MTVDEKIILEGLKRGDNSAYKYLYDSYYSLLCGIASEYLDDSFTAQLLVDKLIFNIFKKRKDLEITVSLRSYLVRSIRNASIDYLRSERYQKEIPFSRMETSESRLLADVIPDDSSPDTLSESELEIKIHEAIDRLPESCRTVFKKNRFEEKTYENIATELNISINTVKYHIRNALFRLHKDLGKYFLLLTFSCI